MAGPSVERWREELQKAKADADKVRSDLQRWELLGSQKGAASERGRQGTAVRDALGRLKETRTTLERLSGELAAMRTGPATSEATRKTLTAYGDELAQVQVQLQDMQQRARGAAGPPVGSAASWSAAPSPGLPAAAGVGPRGELRASADAARVQQAAYGAE
ncbi:unnamed protein product [Prorocentrum cordatum]|uniref:Uncharacterized protein n=1 Tax=Prorocentrum cordatum TaxID=2364126 RepID=A0ABN9TDY7_9DINO|nr:unnamed protein product [Polarella glacialis]